MHLGRRDVLKLMGAGTMVAGMGGVSFAQPPKRKPNIVFILADDMGWSDLGCYGGEISTPNLDKIAERGVRFTQMHNTAKCFPSRACLLTGLYAQQCGMSRGAGSFSSNAGSMGEVFRAGGYRTLAFGKHHSNENLYNRGFDHYWGLRDGAANFFNPGLQRPGEPMPGQKKYGKRVFCFDEKTVVPYTPEKGYYSTDAYTDWALEHLDKYENEDKPFLLYLSYQAPHDPLQAWPEDIEKYMGKYKVGYKAIRDARYKRQREMGLIDDSFPLSEPEHKNWDDLSEEKKKDQELRMAVYAAMIDCMDRNIGRVLEKIQAMGEEDNTIVMFASDNGCNPITVERGDGPIGAMDRWSSLGQDWANVSNTPFRYYKNYSHEGGICTPFIISWPEGLKNVGGFNHFPCHFIDVMTTITDAAGVEYPEKIDDREITSMPGESLMPVLAGAKTERDSALFWQWAQGKAVRMGKWKMVSDRKRPWKLHDMDVDKTETNDLAETHPEVVKELEAMYEKWYAESMAVSKK